VKLELVPEPPVDEPDDDLFALAAALQTLAQVSPEYVVLVDRLLPKDER
jgi:hypothetical protein